MIRFNHDFEKIINIENLLQAWSEFSGGKCDKRDVQEFYLHLMDNILALHNDLISYNYQHGAYLGFNICDSKPRNIHKATVRDRLLHQAIYRKLYPFFDRVFIADSYSCQVNKGVHKALERFKEFAYRASKNNTKTCWILKGDIKQFFASIDHKVLMLILQKYITDKDLLWLLRGIIESFSTFRDDTGLPLGNLTSQLFVNIYMNEFDQFIKNITSRLNIIFDMLMIL
jgi:RNA-directed DNA polymerase